MDAIDIANPGGCSAVLRAATLECMPKCQPPGRGGRCSSCVSPGGFPMLEISSERQMNHIKGQFACQSLIPLLQNNYLLLGISFFFENISCY